jgi:hypothetical protein
VLTGLVVGTRLPIVSADAAWRGIARGAGGARRWWALAIGHVPAGAGRPAVTFTRGRPGSRHSRRTTVRPAPMGGLWVAAAFGRYTMVRCQLTTLEGGELLPRGDAGGVRVDGVGRPAAAHRGQVVTVDSLEDAAVDRAVGRVAGRCR